MKFLIEKAMGGTAEDGKAILNEERRKPAASVIFVPTDEDIVKAVETNPTAIGIVDVYNITSAVSYTHLLTGHHGFLRALGSVQSTLSGLRRQRMPHIWHCQVPMGKPHIPSLR